MAIRNSNNKTYYTFAKGVDNTTDVNSRDIDGTISVGLNCDLVSADLLVKRNGYIEWLSTWGSSVIRTGIQFTDASGTTSHMVYGEASIPTGSSGSIGKIDSSDVFTSLFTGLSDANRMCFVQFSGLLFGFNGVNDFVSDGVTKTQIGITAPAIAPSLNTLISGNMNTNADYVFVYTYYNSVTGAESSPSLPSSIINTGASTGIRISIAAGDPTTADLIRVYRTFDAAGTYFLEGTTAITSTTFNSIAADTSLTLELEPDNERLPNFAKYAAVLDNRFFVAGFQDNPNRVRYSKIGQEGPMPQSFQALDFVDCNINDGDKIIGVGTVGGSIVVLKRHSVGKLVRIEALEKVVELGGSTKYVYQEISRNVSGISHFVMQTIDNVLVWLGQDEIYGTDGSKIIRFGRRISSTLRDVNYQEAEKFSVINKQDSKQIIFSVCLGADTEPNYQIVAHYKFEPFAFTFYSPGTDTTTHPGIQAGCLFEKSTESRLKYYFGNSNGNGKIYQLDSSQSDDGLGIQWDVRLPWEFSGNPAAHKMFHSMYAFILGDGSDYEVQLSFEADYENSTAFSSVSVQAGGTVDWDADVWDNFNWSVLQFALVKLHPHRRAYIGRYGFFNDKADQPIAVKGVSTISLTAYVH